MLAENVIRFKDEKALAAPNASPTPRQSFHDNELLVGVSREACAQIESKIEVRRLSPREIIFEEDEPGDSLYLIAQGSVRISKRGRGGQQETLTFLMEKDFFGEMALVDTGKRSAQAAAVDHVVVGRMDRATWDLLLRLAPHEVMSNFTRTVTRRLRQNNQYFIEQMMRSERLSLLGTTIGAIVHDMNNPISTILGACQVIQSNIHDELTDKMSGLIREAVERMELMTRELIDFSRGETELNLKSFPVADLLRSLESDFAKCRPAIDVRIEVLYDGKILADRHRLLRVLGNLIRNAREAMKQKEGNVLRFTLRQVDSSVRFEVADTGCGIPGELLPRVFEAFVTYGKTGGTGLGLAISKSVVEAHHGTISVQSNGSGTTFLVDLPLGAAAPNSYV
jgi:signal transduction histidine kinase